MSIKDTSSKAVTSAFVEEFREQVQGMVVTAADQAYEEARMAWNLSAQQYPSVILQAESPEDVVAGIRFARMTDLSIKVQSTGHGVVYPADDCLMITTSRMNSIQLDTSRQTAWIEAGAKWGEVLELTHPAGLAPLLGSSPGVGAIGYTLGGGLGWLARKYGLSADSVLAFEVVTASGDKLRANPDENDDLFWALRGGGGGFAIVLKMEIQLYPVAQIYGGTLFYSVESSLEALLRYRDWIESLPEEMTTSYKIMNFPPLPEVPEQFRGKSFVLINGCYCGNDGLGSNLLEPWLTWQTPLMNTFASMPFSAVGMISNDPENPMPAYSSGAWLQKLSDRGVETIVNRGVNHEGSSPLALTEVRHVGGAMARIDSNHNAFGYRKAPLLLNIISGAFTPEMHRNAAQFSNQFIAELNPDLAKGTYLNFLDGGDAIKRSQDAFPPETYHRLKAIKAKYDPDNLFRSGFNIPPM